MIYSPKKIRIEIKKTQMLVVQVEDKLKLWDIKLLLMMSSLFKSKTK